MLAVTDNAPHKCIYNKLTDREITKQTDVQLNNFNARHEKFLIDCYLIDDFIESTTLLIDMEDFVTCGLRTLYGVLLGCFYSSTLTGMSANYWLTKRNEEQKVVSEHMELLQPRDIYNILYKILLLPRTITKENYKGIGISRATTTFEIDNQ
uniref:Uncharacterized protein n=1 Tax=Glossina brevipalpis TaxID=37001 RepID=A0A1A9WPA5_9MUSC